MSAQDYYNQGQGYGYNNGGQQGHNPNPAPPQNYYQQQVRSAPLRLQITVARALFLPYSTFRRRAIKGHLSSTTPTLPHHTALTTIPRNSSHTPAFRRGIRHLHMAPSSSKAHTTLTMGIRHIHQLLSSRAHTTFPKPKAMHRGSITSHSIMAVNPRLGQLLRCKQGSANRRTYPLARAAFSQRLQESLAAPLVERQTMLSD
ncbi:hypothetical protein MMYC01_209858 [Madurella mycetomatis]|uniref:Uncharacterized protein n=1 Tax=Madurella mycetomatis TaxID=100816 RepID=A0A175VTY8_9PEZI|nr:hypothetical protein MMYC01_209858 [Madurella mycetomatis]